jgi:hypothetical protein
MWKKKIAVFLIVFMVGSWCLYAEDTEDKATGLGPIAGGIIAITLTILLGWWMVDSLAYVPPEHAPSGEEAQPIPASSISPIHTKTLQQQSKESGHRTFSNLILDHIEVGAFDRDVYVGVRFGF